MEGVTGSGRDMLEPRVAGGCRGLLSPHPAPGCVPVAGNLASPNLSSSVGEAGRLMAAL